MDNTNIENYFKEPEEQIKPDKGFDERPWEGIPPLSGKLCCIADKYQIEELKNYALEIGKLEDLLFNVQQLCQKLQK